MPAEQTNTTWTLSQRRAESTLEYIVNHGIERSRLTAKGYGEEVPLNDCTKPHMCTEEQYAKNRRSEFTETNTENKNADMDSDSMENDDQD